jgi:hypothetical protein
MKVDNYEGNGERCLQKNSTVGLDVEAITPLISEAGRMDRQRNKTGEI